MTSILNYINSSSSNPSLPHVNRPTTFIIQPPSSAPSQDTTLLAKRHKTAELGDLLMKKIKTQTSSENNSNQHSPHHQENFEDVYDGLESRSMIEEGRSPSMKSHTGDNEKNNDSLFAQRSVSTPLIFGSLGLGLGLPRLGNHNNQRQVQNALEALQRKLLFEQQAASLREMILKAKLAHGPLSIPPLVSTSNSTATSLKKEKSHEGKNFKNDEDGPEIIVGEVEYPLLSLANPLFGSNASSKGHKIVEAPLFESLTATRAETQRSDSEMNEELSEGEGKRKRNKKGTNSEKGKKTQKKEKDQGKSKAKKQSKEPLSPVVAKKKRMTERKPNKWQLSSEVGAVEGSNDASQ